MNAQFFIDENMLPIGRALAAVRDDVVHPGHPDIPEVPIGALDPDWLPVVGAQGYDLVVITRDKKIRKKSAEALALREHRVRMFVLMTKHDLTRWGKLDLLVRSWDRLEKRVAADGAGPWVQGITVAKIKDLQLW